jgi:CRISPR-associated exonuclease Cas4
VIHYPNSMRKVDVEFTEKDSQALGVALQEIRNILDRSKPPSCLKKRFCSKCAYFDFCFA